MSDTVIIIAMLIWVGAEAGPYPSTLPNFATIADCEASIPVVKASYGPRPGPGNLTFISASCVTLPPMPANR